MDTRKVTLVATIAVIALLAVGIGYAYTAMTSNTGNTTQNENIVITQNSDGAYQFAPKTYGTQQNDYQRVYWNTEDFKDPALAENNIKTRYALSGVTDKTTIPGYTMVQIGKDFTLTVTPHNVPTITDLNGTIAAENLAARTAPTDGDKATSLFLVVTAEQVDTQYFKQTGANAFTKVTFDNQGVEHTAADNYLVFAANDQATGYKVATVKVYYGYQGTGGIVVTHAKGAIPAGPETNPIDDVKLSFSVTQNGQNGTGTPVTALSLSKYTMNITGTNTDTATVTITGGTSPTYTVTSSNTGIATVSKNNNTITVTGVAAGTAYIYVLTDEGGYQQIITVNVTAAAAP